MKWKKGNHYWIERYIVSQVFHLGGSQIILYETLAKGLNLSYYSSGTGERVALHFCHRFAQRLWRLHRTWWNQVLWREYWIVPNLCPLLATLIGACSMLCHLCFMVFSIFCPMHEVQCRNFRTKSLWKDWRWTPNALGKPSLGRSDRISAELRGKEWTSWTRPLFKGFKDSSIKPFQFYRSVTGCEIRGYTDIPFYTTYSDA